MNDVPHSAPGQQWQASRYAHHAGLVPALGAEVAKLLDPKAGERILDDALRLLSHSLCDSHSNWTADYVRLRLKAHR